MGIFAGKCRWRGVLWTAFLLVLLCGAVTSTRAQDLSLTITNTEGFDRMGETVSLPWDELRRHIPSIDPASVAVQTLPENMEVLIQRTGEDLLLQVDIGAEQSREFLIRSGVLPPARIQPRVDGRFVLPREDYAWENDRIAFRVYGPALAGEVRNGIDVWTKRVRYLIVQKWYRESEEGPPGQDSYHVDRGEGADFFSVGRSLGAGAAALWSNGTLHQPGVFSSWRTIVNGPLRIEFELTYDSILVDGVLYNETRRIRLDAGSNLNRIDVTYWGEDAAEDLVIACGLVKRPGTVVRRNEPEGWMSLWGATNADTANGFLGTGVILAAGATAGSAEDSIHTVMLGKAGAGVPFTYYAGAGWTRSGDFDGADDWQAYLSHFSRALRSPLKLSLSRAGQ